MPPACWPAAGPTPGCSSGPSPCGKRPAESTIAKDPGWFIADKVAVIDLDGLIMQSHELGLLGPGENPVSLFVEKIDKAQADPNVKAVVLRVNSPGGGVAASDIMYQRLVRFRQQTHRPVVAVIEDVGASGAYYLACGSDTILANPTSITGSIGVIAQTLSIDGTMKLVGIQAKAVTSGEFKDMGSPLKPLEQKDLDLLKTMVDEFFGRFLKVVQAGRPKLTAERIKQLADGRVYTGEQALANGLVDKLGYVEDGVALAKQLSGAPRVKVVMYDRPLGYRANVYSASPLSPAQVNLLNVNMPGLMALSQPQFLYLWTGAAP